MKKILFVCTGNTCRSPMAEAMFNVIAQKEGLEYRGYSCGIYTVSGLPASENSRLACDEVGVDLSGFQSTSVDEINLDEYELIACMTESHREALLSFGVPYDKIYVLSEEKDGICDPYGGNLGRYIICRNELILALRELISKLNDDSVVTLRKLSIEDTGDIHSLASSIFSTPWSESTIESMLKSENTALIGAFKGDVLVGFTALEWVLDEGSLTEIAVISECRREGIANKLMEELIKVAEKSNLAFVTLEVRESNLPAISLYKKFGFSQVGVRKNYYKNPTENAILMTKEKP